MENEQEIPKYEVKPLEPLALPESCESGPKGLVVNGKEVPFVAAPVLPSTQTFPTDLVVKQTVSQKYPVITDAERLAVRDSQFQRTQTREQANVAVRNADQQLTNTINTLAQKYKIDPKVAVFNMVELRFMDAPKK